MSLPQFKLEWHNRKITQVTINGLWYGWILVFWAWVSSGFCDTTYFWLYFCWHPPTSIFWHCHSSDPTRIITTVRKTKISGLWWGWIPVLWTWWGSLIRLCLWKSPGFFYLTSATPRHFFTNDVPLELQMMALPQYQLDRDHHCIRPTDGCQLVVQLSQLVLGVIVHQVWCLTSDASDYLIDPLELYPNPVIDIDSATILINLVWQHQPPM